MSQLDAMRQRAEDDLQESLSDPLRVDATFHRLVRNSPIVHAAIQSAQYYNMPREQALVTALDEMDRVLKVYQEAETDRMLMGTPQPFVVEAPVPQEAE